MKKEDIYKYINKKVLIILKNNFKFTGTIPEFEDDCFEITDKYGKKILVSCDFISLICEVDKNDRY
jgi:small nuclear ribonucleoprotein (snRNP)-like protein